MHKFKDINLDLLKVIACVGVVLLHTEMGGFNRDRFMEFFDIFILLRNLFYPSIFYS
ncbi:repeating unit O-acetyltransferase WefK [Streptococcus pneumoniae]|nr:repeating unit O-acetyltransferase WefK [Streptococcus pneumoniae]